MSDVQDWMCDRTANLAPMSLAKESIWYAELNGVEITVELLGELYPELSVAECEQLHHEILVELAYD